MEQLVIGDDDCQIRDIIEIIGDSPVNILFGPKLFNVALALGTPTVCREKVRRKININQDMSDIEGLSEFLEDWRSRKDTEAKLITFIAILEKNGLNVIAARLTIRKHYSNNSKSQESSGAATSGNNGNARLGIRNATSQEAVLRKHQSETISKKRLQESSETYASNPDDIDGNCLTRRCPHYPELWKVQQDNLLTVTVKAPKLRMMFDDDDYKLPVDSKGNALLMNLFQFRKNTNRIGAIYDTHNMLNLWESLGYKVDNHDDYDEDFTPERVTNILSAFKQKCVDEEVKSFVIFIGSHGNYPNIEMTNGAPLNLYKYIVYELCACPDRNHKDFDWAKIPKIFIFSTCRDFTDASTMKPIENAILCFSALPGYKSYRDPEKGTDYVRCLTEVMMEEAHRKDFESILKMTENKLWGMKKRQMSTYETYGNFGKLYFNLKPS